jgi:hypothetical protein
LNFSGLRGLGNGQEIPDDDRLCGCPDVRFVGLRRRWRWWLASPAAARAKAGSDADANSDSDSDADAHSDAHAYADTDSNADPNADVGIRHRGVSGFELRSRGQRDRRL